MTEPDRSVLRGALIGAAAGLVASYAMDRFQEVVSPHLLRSGGGGEPSTVKLAERLRGQTIPDEEKASAGATVHYGFGSILGAVYGAASEVEPRVTSGFGVLFGVSTAIVVDETIVPALRLSPRPWMSPPALHAYSMASHVVFGAILEAGRRALRHVF